MEQHSFALEHLEGRTLFCVAAPADAAPLADSAALQASTHVKTASHTPLAGAFNVAGRYTQPIGNPDAGAHYHFAGSGRKQSLGNFTLAGDVQGPGFVANGHASGSLLLTTSHGTIKLKVVGPPQSPGSLPSSLTFRIVKGTGAYVNSTGTGHIGVSASGATHKFLFRFNPAA